MGLSLKRQDWLSYTHLRAHACTLAIAVSLNSTWRVVRDCYRYGGIQYMLLYTIATLVIALPLTLLQIAAGQLSQQDAVGVWRAVPFFKGIGYIKILTSFFSAIYTSIYESLTLAMFLYSTRSPMPFVECSQFVFSKNDYENLFNSSNCLSETFLAPVQEKPEYYLAVVMLNVLVWITFPYVLCHPVKAMKRIFYVIGPLIVIICVVITTNIGSAGNVLMFSNRNNWIHYLEPYIWHAALSQALISAQLGGGFLISAGDTVYNTIDVTWSTIILLAANLIASWFGVLMWYSIDGSEHKDTSVVAIIIQIYKIGESNQYHKTWTLLVYFMVLMSGLVSLVTFFYPLYDRFQRISDSKWRITTAFCSLIGGGLSMAVLAQGLPAIGLIDDIAVPYLVSMSAVLEVVVFVFIYGWKTLCNDIEFLINYKLKIFWVLGWCAEPGIIIPFTVWWIVKVFFADQLWTQIPMLATIVLSFLIIGIFAAVSVARQVQFDCLSKLKSSFSPARHWGPRDPITHYYWSARRRETLRINTTNLWNRDRTSFEDIYESLNDDVPHYKDSKRSNSDDKYWTVHRREKLAKSLNNKIRSKSFEINDKTVKIVTFRQ